MVRDSSQKTKIKKSSNRRRKNSQKTSRCSRYTKVQKAFKKAETSPLSKFDLLPLLRNTHNFLGFFACNELESLCVIKSPSYLIVNTDHSAQPGSHWIAMRIGKTTFEIFDSLKLSASYPKQIIQFIKCYSISHTIYVSPVLQAPYSYACGLFCVYFILYRTNLSFTNCIIKFSTDLSVNSSRLQSCLLKKF